MPIHSEYGIVLALLLAGFAGSVSHCVGMCGPFVLAQSSELKNAGGPSLKGWMRRLLLPYHAGRATTYVVLGVAASLLTGQVLKLAAFSIAAHILLVLAGTLFLFSAFANVFPKYSVGMCGLPGWLMQRITPLLPKNSVASGYVLGLLLGYLPCGLLYAALLAAAATASPLLAAAGMFAFFLGTVPALLAVSLGGHVLLPRQRAWVKTLTTLLMAVNGISLFVIAGRGVG